MRLLFAIFRRLCGAEPATARNEVGVRRMFLFAFPVWDVPFN